MGFRSIVKESFKELLADATTTTNQADSIEKLIHHDVYSAEELLLAEANRILTKASNYEKEDEERLQKLYNMGFGKAQEVERFKEYSDEREKQEALKQKIEYYRKRYPQNKFIDEDTVEKICKKYGLLLADTSDYIAEIPKKNQYEIINFRIARKDIRNSYRFYTYLNIFPSSKGVNPEEEVDGKDMYIIAPEDKLDMQGKEKDGYKLRTKDPIVLQPVHGGWLIVTSWGLEANDELIK